jgi:hypothetical protein
MKHSSVYISPHPNQTLGVSQKKEKPSIPNDRLGWPNP